MVEPLSLGDERLRAVLSYPIFKEEHYAKVLKGLQALGVDQIESIGALDIGSIKILGKGCVGLVVVGRRGQERVAAKILRADANRASLNDEAANLRVANVEGVGPSLFGHSEMVLVMEYIEGVFLARWLQELHAEEEVAFVLMSLLAQCRRLDKAGLDHGELSDAKKHIIVDRNGAPRIIDFETASRKRACRNLTAMVNYLFFKESISLLTGRFVCMEKEALRDALREYKRDPSDEAYKRLMRQVGLEKTI
jgi:putative serine/threonine protein kinase